MLHDGSSGEVSYWVAAQARGRGIATHALSFQQAKGTVWPMLGYALDRPDT
ncbi:MAG: hypothetical protein ABSA93_33775 [Streptosporangiaceae bacterium]